MQKTLVLDLDEAVREASLWEVDKPREEWLFGYPAELALLAGQVTSRPPMLWMLIGWFRLGATCVSVLVGVV